MAGPEKSENDSPDTDKMEAQDNPGAPEQVDAEIVDQEEGGAAGEAVMSAETVQPDEGSGAAPDKPGMSPGTVLLGLAAFVFIAFMLSLGGKDDGSAKNDVGDGKADKAQMAMASQSVAGKDAAVSGPETPAAKPETDEPESKPVRPASAEREAIEAVTGSATQVSEIAVNTEEEAPELPERAEPELTADQLIEQNRRAAIERARARREARAQAKEAKAQEQKEAQAAAETEPAQMTAPETPKETEAEQVAEVEEGPAPEPESAEQSIDEAPGEALMTEDKLVNQLALLKADVLAETRAEMVAGQEQLAQQEEQLAQLEKRLDKIQNSGISSGGKQAAISLATSNLQRQMFAGRAFADELETLEGMLPSLRTYELKNYAQTGVPTISALRKEYAQVVRKALAATRREGASGPGAKLGARFAGLFSVRKVGQVEGDSPSAIMSRAEAYLEDGNLSQTLRELDALEGVPAEAFEGWMADARARMRGEQLIDTVSNRILSELQ